MPTYSYRCSQCGVEADHDFPIGTARRVMACPACMGMARLIVGAGVNIAPSALENRGESVRAVDAKEREWDKDMPAYKRMRSRGMQPAGIDGSAQLEDKVGDQLDVDYKELMENEGVTRERVIEGTQEAAEIMANGVPL